MFWTRPDTLKYPDEWHWFAKTKSDGDMYSFTVRDVKPEDHPFLMEQMIEHYIRHEPVSRAFGIIEDSDSLRSLKHYWSQIFQQRLALICYEDNRANREANEYFVGCIMTCVKRKQDPMFQFGGTALTNKLKLYDYIYRKKINIYEHFGIDEYISEAGMFVVPKYRNLYMGAELLKARHKLAKAIGSIEYTVSIFTSTASQKVARKANFVMAHRFDITDARRRRTEFNINYMETNFIEIMYQKNIE